MAGEARVQRWRRQAGVQRGTGACAVVLRRVCYRRVRRERKVAF